MSIEEDILFEYRRKIKDFVSRCESPIEENFLLHLFHYLERNADSFTYQFIYDPVETEDSTVTDKRKGVHRKSESMAFVIADKLVIREMDQIVVTPQALIEFERKYRVDFLFSITRWDNSKRHICIECDGREFHHRTQAQIDRDNQRDRDILSHGYFILRYSGSEIFRTNYPKFDDFMNQILRLSRFDLIEKSNREKVKEVKAYVDGLLRSGATSKFGEILMKKYCKEMGIRYPDE